MWRISDMWRILDSLLYITLIPFRTKYKSLPGINVTKVSLKVLLTLEKSPGIKNKFGQVVKFVYSSQQSVRKCYIKQIPPTLNKSRPYSVFYVTTCALVSDVTGSWMGGGNQYIQLVKLVYCKLRANGSN